MIVGTVNGMSIVCFETLTEYLKRVQVGTRFIADFRSRQVPHAAATIANIKIKTRRLTKEEREQLKKTTQHYAVKLRNPMIIEKCTGLTCGGKPFSA